MIRFNEIYNGWYITSNGSEIIEENLIKGYSEERNNLFDKIVFSKHKECFVFEGVYTCEKERSNIYGKRFYKLKSKYFPEEQLKIKTKQNEDIKSKSVLVEYNNKYLTLDEFLRLYNNRQIVEADLTWVKMNSKIPLFIGKEKLKEENKMLIPLIGVFKTWTNCINQLVFKCKSSGNIFLLSKISSGLPLPLSVKEKITIENENEIRERLFNLENSDYEHTNENLTSYEIMIKWFIEHPYSGGGFSGK